MHFAVVRNIPQSLQAADLRWYFQELVDQGAFACFHYLHRIEESQRDSDTPKSICIVRFSKRYFQNRCISDYNGRKWYGRDGVLMEEECVVVKFEGAQGVYFSGPIQSSRFLYELQPDHRVMPNGNVGTPTSVFVDIMKHGGLEFSALQRIKVLLSVNINRRMRRPRSPAATTESFQSPSLLSPSSTNDDAFKRKSHGERPSIQGNIEPPTCLVPESSSSSVVLSAEKNNNSALALSFPGNRETEPLFVDVEAKDETACHAGVSVQNSYELVVPHQAAKFDWKSWTKWYLTRVYCSNK